MQNLLLFLGLLSLLHPVYVSDTFDDDTVNSRWVISKDAKFNGTWGFETRKVDFSNGTIKGIAALSPSNYHAISTKKEFKATGDTFVLQFENKIQSSSFSCGGSYIKLLSENFTPADFNNENPFVIMFGPDKCGETNQIHFIYRTQNPVNKVWSEHKLKTKIPGLYDNVTHLYTLVIKKDDTFEIKIDNKVKTTGDLHDDELFDTPFQPSKTIPDPTDSKPSDWVDIEQIPDPTDKKPEDWDENEPATILDPNAKKPEDWKEDEPLEIDDVNSVKPEGWNENEDGPFQPGKIDNPYCAEHGCGPWKAPEIKNPKFKGKWKAKMIPNPEFKGKWKAREIDNPNFFTPAKNLYLVGSVYGLGFELVTPVEQWFGGIYIGDSEAEAANFAKEHWAAVNAAEVAEKEKYAKKKKSEEYSELLGKLGKGGVKENLMTLAELANEIYIDHPVLTIVGIILFIGVFVGLIVCCWLCCCPGKNEVEDTGIKDERTTGEEKTKDGEEEEEEEQDDENEVEKDEDDDEKEDEGEKRKEITNVKSGDKKKARGGSSDSKKGKNKEKNK